MDYIVMTMVVIGRGYIKSLVNNGLYTLVMHIMSAENSWQRVYAHILAHYAEVRHNALCFSASCVRYIHG